MINNNFLKNYNFEKKNIYVFGGSGLIGSSISNLFLSLRSNLIILDKTNKTIKYADNLKLKILIIIFVELI